MLPSDVPLYVPLLVAAGVGTALCSAFAWRRRNRTGATALAAFGLSVAGWCFVYAAAIASPTLSGSYRWFRVMLAFAVLSSGAWLYVSIRYSGRHDWAGPRTIGALLGPSVVVLVLSFVPGFDSLVIASFVADDASLVGFDADLGFLGSVVALASVVGWLAATLLLCQLFVRSRHLYRGQALAVLVAALAPWGAFLLYTFFIPHTVDHGPVALALSAGALTVACSRHRLLDLSPSGRDAVVDEMDDGALVLNIDECIADVNAAAERNLDLDATAAVGRTAADVFADWEAIRATETDGDWIELVRSVEGTTRYLEATTSTVVDHHGEPAGSLVLVRDVTHRKERELDLARYKTIFERVQDRVYVLDDRNQFVLVNDSLAAMLGYTPEELRGQPFESVLAPSAVETIAEETDDGADEERMNGGVTDADVEDDRLELQIETATGTVIPCEVSRSPIAFDGAVEGTVGVVRDISERKRIERDLRETSRALETLVDVSPVAIVATDPEGQVEVWNPAAESMFGWDVVDVLGERLPFVDEAGRSQFEVYHRRVLGGEHAAGVEETLARRDGSTLRTRISFAPQRDGDGEVSRVVCVVVDISEMKAYERELEAKNEQLETFASTLSHDLRNPLAVAMGYLELGRETGDETHFEATELALDRVAEMTDDLLELARAGKRVIDPDACSLRVAAETAWTTVETDGVALEIGDDRRIRADRSQLIQLFENLFRNASDHAVGVSAGTPSNADGASTSVGEPSVTVVVEATDTGFAVSDDGPGIPESERESVFEQGYTTHHSGTGLGLSIVARIAETHGWTVRVDEVPETGGARFEFDVE
jgi:PAS domain S-box-containing protein